MYVATSSTARRPPAVYVSPFSRFSSRPARRLVAPRLHIAIQTQSRRGRGFGAAPLTTSQQFAAGITAGAATGAQTALVTGSNIEGAVAGGLMAAAPFAGPAAPFLIAASALVAPIGAMFAGCGQSCVVTSQMANQAQAGLEQLKSSYFALPVHYASAQAGTLAYMDQIFAWLRQACGNPQMGSAGVNCIQERLVRGAPAPWCPNPGHVGCDWITAYRDAVANDPAVVPDPSPVSAVAAAFGLNPSATLGGFQVSSLILPALLLGLAVTMK